MDFRHRTLEPEQRDFTLAAGVLLNPDAGVAELMADLRDPEGRVEGFEVRDVALYKNGASTKALRQERCRKRGALHTPSNYPFSPARGVVGSSMGSRGFVRALRHFASP